MHNAVRRWVARHATDEPVTVLEFGARDINGSARELFPHADWCGIDIAEGPGVDCVADATTYRHPDPVDVVVCTEVFEHAPNWPEIVASAYRNLKLGGRFIATMAGPGRKEHGKRWYVGEWHYHNVAPGELESVLRLVGFEDVTVDVRGKDVRCVATR